MKYDSVIYEEPGYDGELARFAKVVPGFGGMSISDDGEVTYLLKYPGLGSKHIAQIEQHLQRITAHRERTLGNAPVKKKFQDFKILKADYDFRELLEAKRKIRTLFGAAPIIFVDIDETTNRIEIGTASDADTNELRAKVKALQLPAGMFRFVQTSPRVPARTLTDKANPAYPLVGGLQIYSSAGICSLGVNAYVNGLSGFLTASHCTSTIGAVNTSLGFYQPNFAVGNLIGYENFDPPTFPCSASSKCRYSDAAFIRYNSTAVSRFGALARPTTTSTNTSINLTIYDNAFFTISGSFFEPAARDVIYKVGKTTGLQSGQVLRTCADQPAGKADGVSFLCQTEATVFTVSGDSGGPVFSINADQTVNFLGLTSSAEEFTANLIYSPIANVRADFGTGSSVIVE